MDKKKKSTSTSPKVVKGVDQPALINEVAAQALIRKKRQRQSASDYAHKILSKDRVALGQAITIIESTRSSDQVLAQEIIDACLPHAGNSMRIGITGSPGVGKSTFVEAFGVTIIEQGQRVAALAIDPSSQLSRGSILGDKTRMEQLSSIENAFIRPSPAGTSLGGVARKTRESIILCEAAGFNTIIIETVGVGQSEIAVHSMVDLFLLLIAPGGGDELQGIKRGIVEMADIVLVNKSDGDRQALARQTRLDYKNALHLFPAKESNWIPKVLNCSALHKENILDVWKTVQLYEQQTKENDYFEQHRKTQAQYWLFESIEHHLKKQFYENTAVKKQLEVVQQRVIDGQLSPFKGAELLLQLSRK